jgi:hypothetical protein
MTTQCTTPQQGPTFDSNSQVNPLSTSPSASSGWLTTASTATRMASGCGSKDSNGAGLAEKGD